MRYIRKINLNKVPFPSVVEPCDPEQERDEMIAEFEDRIRGEEGYPADYKMEKWDPLYSYFSVTAMKIARERNKINHAVKNRFVVLSSGDDLELNVTEGILERRLPGETDEQLQDRYFSSLLGDSPFGLEDSYVHFVKNKIMGEWGSSQIWDSYSYMEEENAGVVQVVVLPLRNYYEGKEEEEQERVASREKIIKSVRSFFENTPGSSPIADKKIVSESFIRAVDIKVRIRIRAGVGQKPVLDEAIKRLKKLSYELFRIGSDLYRSRILYTAMDENIESCEIILPEEDVITAPNEAILISVDPKVEPVNPLLEDGV